MNELQLFIKELKRYRHLINRQTFKTIRGQAIGGNIEGARKGLKTALAKADAMTMAHRQTKIIKQHNEDVDYKGQFGLSLKESHSVKG